MLHPTFFYHLHKAGGTTFLNLARFNGHTFVTPARGGLPLVSESWGTAKDPFEGHAGAFWSFWEEEPERLRRWIGERRADGVDFFTQEYGRVDVECWRDMLKVACIRHPVNRLCSNFYHARSRQQTPEFSTFLEWALQAPFSEWWAKNLVTAQLGGGDRAIAERTLSEFDVVVIQEDYVRSVAAMKRFGWLDNDCEVHFKSWTPRRKTSGLSILRRSPGAMARLQEFFADDIYVYESYTATHHHCAPK